MGLSAVLGRPIYVLSCGKDKAVRPYNVSAPLDWGEKVEGAPLLLAHVSDYHYCPVKVVKGGEWDFVLASAEDRADPQKRKTCKFVVDERLMVQGKRNEGPNGNEEGQRRLKDAVVVEDDSEEGERGKDLESPAAGSDCDQEMDAGGAIKNPQKRGRSGDLQGRNFHDCQRPEERAPAKVNDQERTAGGTQGRNFFIDQRPGDNPSEGQEGGESMPPDDDLREVERRMRADQGGGDGPPRMALNSRQRVRTLLPYPSCAMGDGGRISPGL